MEMCIRDRFQELFGITVNRQRLSTGEVAAKIEEENGNPSADVWFGGTTDPYNESVAKGLLEPYEAANASHLLGDMYRDKDGCWYGIYKGILGFMCNTEELERLGLEEPKDWDDLLKPCLLYTSTWLMRIAINTCRDYHRTAWLRHVDRGTPLEALPEAGAEDAHPDGEVIRAVMALPLREREAVLLRYYQEMTIAEAAQALRISQSAVKQRLRRANRRLRDRLKEWYYDA